MPRECIIILGLHMATNFILSVCIQLNEAHYNYSSKILLPLFVFSFSRCFSAFLPFSFIICCLRLCEWRWNKLKSQVSTQSRLPHHDWLEMCQISKSTSRLRNTHKKVRLARGVDFVSDFCHQMTFFLQFPQERAIFTTYHFKSFLAIKMQGVCKITSWRTKFVMTGWHVYLSSPKVSYWWQRLDFWSKMVGITFEALWGVQAGRAEHCSSLVEIWLAK